MVRKRPGKGWKVMAAAKLTLETEEVRGVKVVRVAGPLDSATFDQFREYIEPLVTQKGARIVLDCRNLTYVNSRGVTLLMHYQRMATTTMSYFGVAAFRPHTVKSIEMLGLGSKLKWFPTVDDAMQTAEAM